MDDGLDVLRQLFGVPATQIGAVTMPPNVRVKPCAKCPFGDGKNLTGAEKASAFIVHREVTRKLRENPNYAWGCHETATCGVDESTLVCAGFAAWREIS